jgi:hydroxyacylglutathione hydrolase
MKIISIPCGFNNFTYVLICEQTRTAAAVDPTEAFPVWREAEAAGGQLVAVLCTHHHQDHIGGLEDLLGEQPDLAVYGYNGDADRVPGMNRFLVDGDGISIGKIRGRALHTPGHTTGSICYHFDNVLFTGDTLFGAGCGRLFEGTATEMYRSLTRKILPLADDTLLYFGHEYTEQNLLFAEIIEPANLAIQRRLRAVRENKVLNIHSTPSTLIEEKMTNPFLRCSEKSIRDNYQIAGSDLSAGEIFAMLRQRRDSL